MAHLRNSQLALLGILDLAMTGRGLRGAAASDDCRPRRTGRSRRWCIRGTVAVTVAGHESAGGASRSPAAQPRGGNAAHAAGRRSACGESDVDRSGFAGLTPPSPPGARGIAHRARRRRTRGGNASPNATWRPAAIEWREVSTFAALPPSSRPGERRRARRARRRRSRGGNASRAVGRRPAHIPRGAQRR